MKQTLLFIATCAAMGLVACQAKVTNSPPEDDAAVEYSGESNNGALPQPEDVPPEDEWVEDAGAFAIDHRCCNVAFQIPAEDPDDATGVVRANVDGMREGLPLTRTDAGWLASFCMPLNAVVAYHYEFTFALDAGAGLADDAGWVDDAGFAEDAGLDLGDAGPSLTTVIRASPYALAVSDGQGGMTNIYQVADDCSGADASVGMLP